MKWEVWGADGRLELEFVIKPEGGLEYAIFYDWKDRNP